MREEGLVRLSRKDQWFRFWMPYTFQELKIQGQENVYLPLNRNYKPLGVVSEKADLVNYDDFVGQAVVFSVDPRTLDGVWVYPETLHLYEDAPSSRRDYFQRLERLLSHSMRLYSQSK